MTEETVIPEAVVTVQKCLMKDKVSMHIYIPNHYLEDNMIGSFLFCIREGADWRWEIK